MSTRSGKTYNEPKRAKKRIIVKDTTFDSTISKEAGDENMDISTTSTRDLRSRRSSVKDSTFDKSNSSIKNNDIESATDANWIISDLSNNMKRRKSNVNTHLNRNSNSVTNGHIEKESEVDSDCNVPMKQSRKRKTSVANNTFDKNDKINTTYEKETDKTFEKAETATVPVNKKKRGRNKTLITNEINIEKDNEIHKAYEKDESVTISVNNKKKGKSRILAMSEIILEKDKTFQKDETATVSVDKIKKHQNKAPMMMEINIEKDGTFEKDETTTVSVEKKKKHKNKTPIMSENNIEKDTETDVTATTVSKKKGKNKTLIMSENNIEKDTETDDTATTVSKKKGKNKTLLISEINIEKDTENNLNSSNVVEQQIKKKKKKVKGGKKKKQKGKPKDDGGDAALDKADNILDTTFDKEKENTDISIEKAASQVDKNIVQKDLVLNTSIGATKNLRSSKSNVIDTTFEKENKIVDKMYEKNEKNNDKTFDNKELNSTDTSKVNVTFDKNNKNNDTFEKDASTSFDTFKKGAKTRKSSIHEDYNTSNHSPPKLDVKNQNALTNSAIKTRKSFTRQTTEIINSSPKKLDSTFEKTSNIETFQTIPDASLSKLNATFDKEVSKSSLISSDNSVSRISITSDESAENIMNTTPVLVESSLEVSQVKESPKEAPKTPLKREGTFTKDTSEILVQSPRTPGRSRPSLTPAAGCTPYHIGRSSQKKSELNITRSIEKRFSVEAPRLTRVMFCSPVDNPATAGQEKPKIIKSNLKGSNKSFVFDESASMTRPGRKRSYTQSDVDDARAKRSRLAEDLQQSVDRLSRPRTAGTTVKPAETTPKKATIPFKSKSETKPARTRLPNFAALHQRRFDKMESLGECQERKAKRARQMLTPTGSKNLLERISPTNTTDIQKQTTKEPLKPKDKTDTPTKTLPTLESLRPGFTRFGFKLNLDINPFSVPPKNDKPKQKPNGFLQRPGILPSVAGATSARREVAKQAVMREKSILSKRKLNRSENRTIIKGVRTNRRFELQMKLRNVE